MKPSYRAEQLTAKEQQPIVRRMRLKVLQRLFLRLFLKLFWAAATRA